MSITRHNKINYPGGTKVKTNKLPTNYSNRGMALEDDINLTNNYYIDNDIAYIYKKPTPIKITKVDYPSRQKAVIKEAFFTTPSTTDYNGIYKGKYIDFEAKETNSKSSFSLANIHKHQIKHLENIYRHGGISFLIIRFNKLNKTYLLKAEDLISFLENEKRKSIPLDFFEKYGIIIEEKYNPRLDYLKIIDFLYGGSYGK